MGVRYEVLVGFCTSSCPFAVRDEKSIYSPVAIASRVSLDRRVYRGKMGDVGIPGRTGVCWGSSYGDGYVGDGACCGSGVLGTGGGLT